MSERNTLPIVSRPKAPRPRHLVVVGAAAGMGRWLCDQVFSRAEWDSVLLVDVEGSVPALLEAAHGYAAPVTIATPPDDAPGLRALDGGAPELGRPQTVVVVALPYAALGNALRRLDGALAPDAGIAVVAHGMTRALELVTATLGRERAAYGMHPLFDTGARCLEGETVYLVPAPEPHGNAHQWLVELLRAEGGTLRFGTAARHDESMTIVQALAHQSLIGFAGAVVESGLDLNEDVWATRTPLFETLFGLAARALDETQQHTIAGIQTSLDGQRASAALAAAATRMSDAVAQANARADAGPVEERIRATRDRFSGALFEAVRGTAAAAVVASRSKRTELARHRRSGELVGIRPLGRPDSLRVGRIVEVDPIEVTLLELMVGAQGRAALLDGPGRLNAPRLGLGGKPRETVFSLGHIDLVTGAELEAELDRWLAHLRRDIRFLVPESVAGSGVLEVVTPVPGIGASELISEVVRTGQRSVVVRVQVRSDRDVEDMVETLRTLVQRAFAWPRGLSLPLSAAARAVTYLGPAGTFSEVAAAHLAADVGIADPVLTPVESFGAVLAAVGDGGFGVLPITSSASGLVSRAVEALLAHDGDLAAGGVVDVAVRFDAYIRADAHLDQSRRAPVFSHPQALAQCRNFIRRWELDPVVCDSTTDALRRVAQHEGPAVALAGEGKGAALGLKVAEREVDDLAGSITRFLILGPPGGFGALVGGSDPTLRTIHVAGSIEAVTAALAAGHAAYDEVVSDPQARCLWVTSREFVPEAGSGLRSLGRAPWSPRTPIVRVSH